MLRTRGQQIDYKLFLPAITAAVREKLEDKDTQLTDAEFEAMVALLFRDAVIEFMKETRLYRIEIPIDLYAGVRYYPLIPPEGYYIQAAIRLRAGNRNIPPMYLLDEYELIIDDACCPTCDVDNALYVEAAIVPNITDNNCRFDADFINRHYHAILLGMEKRLWVMARSWRDAQLAALREQQYVREITKSIEGGYYFNKSVKFRYRRFSQGMCPK